MTKKEKLLMDKSLNELQSIVNELPTIDELTAKSDEIIKKHFPYADNFVIYGFRLIAKSALNYQILLNEFKNILQTSISFSSSD